MGKVLNLVPSFPSHITITPSMLADTIIELSGLKTAIVPFLLLGLIENSYFASLESHMLPVPSMFVEAMRDPEKLNVAEIINPRLTNRCITSPETASQI